MPQVVPSATFVAASTQTEVPVEHEVAPLWHGLATNGQARPAVHALHVPALQTWFSPQLVPSARLTPESRHTELPVEHDVVPVWQAFAGVQATLAVQEMQAPELQTWSVPQVVPSGMLPVSVQTAVPLAHSRVAVRQGFADTQGPPQRSKSHVAEMVPREEQLMR